MKEIFRHLHHCFNKHTPAPRGIYAIDKGDYVGEFFVYVKTMDTGEHCFLGLPKMEKRLVPAESFNSGIKNKIMVFVQKLPKPIHKICCQQYDTNIDKRVKHNK